MLLLLLVMLKPTRHMFPGDVTGTVDRDRVVTRMLVQPVGGATTGSGRRAVAGYTASRHRPHQQ